MAPPSPRSTAPIRFVVFDLFDTLVDLHMEWIPVIEVAGRRVAGTAPELYRAFSRRIAGVAFEHFAEVLATVDREYRESRYAKGLELPTSLRFTTVVERLGVDPDGGEGLVRELVGVHMGALCEQVRFIDHHPAVLDALRDRARLALCSNFSHSPTALELLEKAGLRGRFDAVVVSDQHGIRKPRPEIFRETLDALGATPEETLHVGDNLEADVAGAAALGIRTAWITRRIPEPDDRLARHEGPPPDHRVTDLAELVPLLRTSHGA